MLRELTSAEELWIERVGPPRVAPTHSIFPDDAVGVIYKPVRSAMTSGKARTRQWKLRFERRSPQFIEPLMGWTGGEDTLTQVELTFPSAEAAVAYARRQGLQFIVQGADGNEPALRLVSDDTLQHSGASTARSAMDQRRRLEWVERTLGTKAIRGGREPGHPATDYACPKDVLTDGRLLPAQKREVLRSWALDELAQSRGELHSEFSPLDEVIDAILDLDELQGSTLPRRRIPAVSSVEACAA